jgi:putative ABC transport system permease protein
MKRSGVRRLFSLSLRRDRWADEVEEEILAHLTHRAERLVALGMSPQAARDEAVRRFGTLDESRARMIEAATHREEYMRRRESFAELRQDLAFAFRSLSRNKGWATVAILTLALGIAATTAVWSAASTLLLHPLKYPGASRVVHVDLMPTSGGVAGVSVVISTSGSVVRAWQRDARSFEALEPYQSDELPTVLVDEPADLMTTRVTPGFAAFAGARPIRGRNFSAADVAAKAPVAMLGEGLWRAQYGSDTAIIGKSIRVGSRVVQVIGVMPASLRTPVLGDRPTEVWLLADLMNERDGFRVVGRLRPGISTETARRELDLVAQRVSGMSSMPFRAAVTTPGQSVAFRSSLLMLTGAVLLVLLVAGTNVAHLIMARALTRQRELAIRAAVGASRGRMGRQLMTETITLSVVGTLLGTVMGFAALRALIAIRPNSLSDLDLAYVDGRTLAATFGIALVCGVVFGVLASLAGDRATGLALRAGAASLFSRRGERLRSTLVVSEMALSTVLLVGALLLVRSVIELQRWNAGFDPAGLYALSFKLPPSSFATPAARGAATDELASAIARIPGVKSVAVATALPGNRNFSVGALQVEGDPAPPANESGLIDVGSVAPSFFRTMGTPLVEGSLFSDTTAASHEVIINEGFARHRWPNASAVGRRMRIAFQGHSQDWLTVVGVAKDISYSGPAGDRTAPFLYRPAPQAQNPGILLRTTNPAAIDEARALFKSRLGKVQLTVTSSEAAMARSLAAPRFIMLLMAGFTVLSVLLAAVGLYGMMAYSVVQRTREIGIRIALGASRDRIARSVVGRGAALGLGGAAIGLLLATWATRLIEGSLFGVERLDASAFILGGALLVLIAVIACIAPMRRAISVDPITSIRAD